jgi:hypothetical protein
MLDFLTSLTVVHAALFVSMLALLISIRSVSIAEKSRRATERRDRDAERARVYEKRTEILSEIDKQNARLGTLMLILAEKLLLLQRTPSLREKHQNEYDRLMQNLKAVQTLRSRYEEQRRASEAIDAGSRLLDLDPVLADVRRLSIHVEEDIEKETRSLEQLRQSVQTDRA